MTVSTDSKSLSRRQALGLMGAAGASTVAVGGLILPNATAVAQATRGGTGLILPTSNVCMLTPEMHNRSIIDASFAGAGAAVQPAIETNSVLTLVLSVLAGEVCSVLPGALVAVALQYPELEALPLIEPLVVTPIGMLISATSRQSLGQKAAVRLARDAEWLAHASAHSGPLLG